MQVPRCARGEGGIGRSCRVACEGTPGRTPRVLRLESHSHALAPHLILGDSCATWAAPYSSSRPARLATGAFAHGQAVVPRHVRRRTQRNPPAWCACLKPHAHLPSARCAPVLTQMSSSLAGTSPGLPKPPSPLAISLAVSSLDAVRKHDGWYVDVDMRSGSGECVLLGRCPGVETRGGDGGALAMDGQISRRSLEVWKGTGQGWEESVGNSHEATERLQQRVVCGWVDEYQRHVLGGMGKAPVEGAELTVACCAGLCSPMRTPACVLTRLIPSYLTHLQ